MTSIPMIDHVVITTTDDFARRARTCVAYDQNNQPICYLPITRATTSAAANPTDLMETKAQLEMFAFRVRIVSDQKNEPSS